MKMYLAVGLDAESVKSCGPSTGGYPQSSPYLQSGKLFFARGDKEAQRTATELLGNAPRFVTQIGNFEADITRTEVHSLSETKTRVKFKCLTTACEL